VGSRVKNYSKDNFGIIVAAGMGRRFGGLKQFARVKNRPLLYYSIRAFELCPVVTGYVVVTNVSRVSTVKNMLSAFVFKKALAVVAGGNDRMDSVEQGLFELPDSGYVAVHDGVRPLIKPTMLSLGFRAVRRYPAVAFGVPVIDTLKEVVDKRIVQTVDRTGIVAIQTPQFFTIDLLRRAYAQARNQQLVSTDECQLVEKLGVAPKVLAGFPENIKVTYPADLRICVALL